MEKNERKIGEISKKTKAVKAKNIVSEIGIWIACVIIAVILALVIKYYIFTPTVVKQSSMFPTLISNQRLILNRYDKTFKKMPKRFEIVTFEAPNESFPAASNLDENEKAELLKNPVAKYANKNLSFVENIKYNILETTKVSYIKRVIALPGEHVQIKDGAVYINDQKLDESKYIGGGITTENIDGIYSDFVVPENTFFALGDNRPNSVDCRFFGCIPLDKIEGTVSFRFWPLSEFGKIEK